MHAHRKASHAIFFGSFLALIGMPALAAPCDTTHTSPAAKQSTAEVVDRVPTGPVLSFGDADTGTFCSVSMIDETPVRLLHTVGEMEGLGRYRITHDDPWTGVHIGDEAEALTVDPNILPIAACRFDDPALDTCTLHPDGTEAVEVTAQLNPNGSTFTLTLDPEAMGVDVDAIDPRFRLIIRPPDGPDQKTGWQMNSAGGVGKTVIQGTAAAWFASLLDGSGPITIAFKMRDGEIAEHTIPALAAQKASYLTSRLRGAQRDLTKK